MLLFVFRIIERIPSEHKFTPPCCTGKCQKECVLRHVEFEKFLGIFVVALLAIVGTLTTQAQPARASTLIHQTSTQISTSGNQTIVVVDPLTNQQYKIGAKQYAQAQAYLKTHPLHPVVTKIPKNVQTANTSTAQQITTKTTTVTLSQRDCAKLKASLPASIASNPKVCSFVFSETTTITPNTSKIVPNAGCKRTGSENFHDKFAPVVQFVDGFQMELDTTFVWSYGDCVSAPQVTAQSCYFTYLWNYSNLGPNTCSTYYATYHGVSNAAVYITNLQAYNYTQRTFIRRECSVSYRDCYGYWQMGTSGGNL